VLLRNSQWLGQFKMTKTGATGSLRAKQPDQCDVLLTKNENQRPVMNAHSQFVDQAFDWADNTPLQLDF